ncbi:hypothetical protein R3P38DRAFT_700479 [Favolaschia claudopus]|uniref:Uncharacterized protein n=1 Tax=Favolaschia claudopus TaxID=2862362 RepID=A0AAW0C7Q5_9AGAR
MALSPASSLSSLTDDTPELTKDVDLENVYHLVSGVVRDLSLPGGSIFLPSEAQTEMEKIEKLLVGGACRPNHKVAVVGRTGMSFQLLFSNLSFLRAASPLSAADMGGACTSVVTEISYQEGSEAVATVLFKTRQQWETELRHLVTDVHDANNPDSLGKLANIYPDRQDLKKMGTVEKQEMLPEQSKELESSLIDNLLDDPAVKDKLGNTSTVSGTPKDIREKLKPFWAAATWPQGDYHSAAASETHLGTVDENTTVSSICFSCSNNSRAESICQNERGKRTLPIPNNDIFQSNESFIEGSAVPVFEALKSGIKGALAECVELVQAELLRRVRVIVTVITADDKCPSFLAKVRADKEESIFEMMDSLKARVQ